ncbi:packaged DNA stabilization protein [Leisingera sp. ANG-M7]|uniref:packaged DNA stabilization protein n=1 Tax=Leisingera sp. ANG-M7 TaxID=1577902 RepID=UPI00057EEA41|nr:packaged DNA stabilization protein [Leisingera sp. ANG-M7]KIC39359.1 hypothetical protein RA26_01530 [Leisingera sp. ANG-M7]
MPLIPFARQSKDEPGYSGERLKNYFLRQADGIAPAVVLGRSGLLSKYSLAGPVRAMEDLNGTVYAVAGGRVYRISGGTATDVGGVLDDVNTQMASSSDEVAIVAGGKYYICNGTTTTEYTTGAVTSPIGVAFLDGYFLVIGTSGGRADALTISGLDDGTTFDALDFAFAESSADRLVGIVEDHGEIWLFGSKTIEIWFNSGNAAFPFERNTGARIERGAVAGTMAKEDNAVFWVGQDKRAYRSTGSSPTVISTREIEKTIAAGTLSRAFIVDDRGHKFFVIRLTGQPAVVYDITTGLWCEFSTGVGEVAFAGLCSVRETDGDFLVGTSTGAVATLDKETFQDLGGVLEAEAISQPVAEADFFTINRVHMNIDSGDVDATGRVMLQVSKDGHTWGLEKWRNLGALGQHFRRVTWNGLGTSRRFQFRIRITDAVQRDINGAKYG